MLVLEDKPRIPGKIAFSLLRLPINAWSDGKDLLRMARA